MDNRVMIRAWSDWDAHSWSTGSAYVDWWQLLKPDGIGDEGGLNTDSIFIPPVLDLLWKMIDPEVQQFEATTSTSYSTTKKTPTSEPSTSPTEGALETDNQISRNFGTEDFALAPIPRFAYNGTSFKKLIVESQTKNWLPDLDELPTITDPRTVIVGVIDTGIPLMHKRLLDSKGQPRVLAAWNQGAKHPFAVSEAPGQDPVSLQQYIPFGREIYASDIQAQLDKGADEESANEELGLVNIQSIFGRRDLMFRAAHGAHVLDTAAGYEPGTKSDLVKIIAVNLPHRQTLGQAGEFLDLFVFYGILRILHLANAIWEKSKLDGKPRVVMNLSYGRQAGSKDGKDFLPRMAEKAPETELGKKTPFDLILPSGNDNLARRNAFVSAKPDDPETLIWRIPPDDRSSNYVEVWTDPITMSPDQFNEELPLDIAVELPGFVEDKTQFGKARSVKKLESYGRVYCERVPATGSVFRIKFQICLAPTMRFGVHRDDVSPAGDWTITLKNRTSQELNLRASIQTDQSLLPAGGSGLSSYFVDPSLERFDDGGRSVDAYGDRFDGLQSEGDQVKQSGTINASGIGQSVLTIGGYRGNDGRATVYSCSGLHHDPHGGTTIDRERTPLVALKSDDGPAHPGTLGAGSRNGSRVLMSGTSFATAMATRLVVEHYLDNPTKQSGAAKEILANKSESERGINLFPSVIRPEKAALGRVESSIRHRIDRF